MALPVWLVGLVAIGVVAALVAFFASQANAALKLVVGVLLAAAVAGVALYVVEIRTARIELVNGATVPLSEVSMELSAGAAERWTEKLDRLEPGASHVAGRRVADLSLGEVGFVLKGKHYRYTGGGLATPGERFILTVTDNGSVEPTLFFYLVR